MKADLHIHTTASDGQYTPWEIAEKAQAAGLEYIAVTDHDTVDSVKKAIRAGEALGVNVISGVEISAKDDKNLHILGYGLDPEDAHISGLCLSMKKSRDERKYRIIKYLAERGVDIPLAEVEQLAGGDIIGRPHFAQIMVKHGYVSSNREAFDKYLDTPEFQKIERIKYFAEKCIEVIGLSGGKAVIAHPWQLRYADDELEKLVAKLTGFGLRGIECYYPKHTRGQTEYYLRLAKKYGLHVTGGSDFHGERVKPDVHLETYELNVNWLLE